MKLTRENLLTFLSAHLLVVAILAIANIVLFTRLALAWNTLRTDSTEQIQQFQANLKTLEFQTAPLRGLPAKVDVSTRQADRFYGQRVPSNYSSISAELTKLAETNHIRQAGVSYTPVPSLPGLVAVGLDVRLTGEYAPIMRYINGLERDKIFFVITGLTLTGQQGGNVNVRLKMTTYLHAANAENMAPPADSGDVEGKQPASSEPADGAAAGSAAASASTTNAATAAKGDQ